MSFEQSNNSFPFVQSKVDGAVIQLENASKFTAQKFFYKCQCLGKKKPHTHMKKF